MLSKYVKFTPNEIEAYIPISLNMSTIANNQYYLIKTDRFKNRLFLEIKGFWNTPDVVPNYFNDLQSGIDQLRDLFTTQIDIRTMKIHPQDVSEMHEECIRMLKKGGNAYSAEVTDERVVSFQINRILESQKMPTQKFSSPRFASSYLDDVFEINAMDTPQHCSCLGCEN